MRITSRYFIDVRAEEVEATPSERERGFRLAQARTALYTTNAAAAATAAATPTA